MTVRELIKKLQVCNQEAIVVMYHFSNECDVTIEYFKEMLLYQFQLVILLVKRFFVSILNPTILTLSTDFHWFFFKSV